jgi:uncharacterized protein (TIGR04141 family)
MTRRHAIATVIEDAAQQECFCFGTGHHAFDGDAFERGFGLRVVLNSVARSSLRSLDIATLDATTFLRRVQASRDADLQGSASILTAIC